MLLLSLRILRPIPRFSRGPLLERALDLIVAKLMDCFNTPLEVLLVEPRTDSVEAMVLEGRRHVAETQFKVFRKGFGIHWSGGIWCEAERRKLR